MRCAMTLMLWAVGFLCAACEEPWQDDFDHVWEGEHVTVYAYGVDEFDAYSKSLELLDVHTASVMAFLRVDPSERYQYRWMTPAMAKEYCGYWACAWHGVVQSPQLPHMHEANHMVATTSVARCQRMLSEGIAVYLEEPLLGHDTALSSEPQFQIETLMNDHRWQFKPYCYLRAGHFVSFLAEHYGGEAIADLCRNLPRESMRRDWERVVPVVLGVTLEQLLSEYADYPECTADQYRARLWECGGEPDIVLDADNRRAALRFTGDEERVITWRTEPKTAVISRRVLFTQDMMVSLEVYVDGNEALVQDHFQSQQCAACSADPQVVDAQAIEDSYPLYPFTAIDYRAGLHEILVTIDESVGDTIELRMQVLSVEGED